MHPGLVDFLEAAKKEGSYLIVGLYEDSAVSQYKGSQYPIQILQERVLSVLANRSVFLMISRLFSYSINVLLDSDQCSNYHRLK